MLYCRLSFYFPFVSLPAYLIVCLNVIIFVCLSFFYLSFTELLQLTLVFLQTDLYKSSVLSKKNAWKVLCSGLYALISRDTGDRLTTPLACITSCQMDSPCSAGSWTTFSGRNAVSWDIL